MIERGMDVLKNQEHCFLVIGLTNPQPWLMRKLQPSSRPEKTSLSAKQKRLMELAERLSKLEKDLAGQRRGAGSNTNANAGRADL